MKLIILLSLLAITGFGQGKPHIPRVDFILHNKSLKTASLLVEGPGIRYGFTMNGRERLKNHWPVGAQLFYSPDGETTNGAPLFVVYLSDANKTVSVVGLGQPVQKPVVSKTADTDVPISFRNNTPFPKRIAFITYKPGETGNGTEIITMMPLTTKKGIYPIGTKVYLGRLDDPDDQQVDIVMSGRPLTDNPFLVVKKNDAGKTFRIFR